MKSVTLLQVLGLCALSTLSIAAAQAGDNCVLSSLVHPAAVSADAGSGATKQAAAAAKDQDLADTIAPIVGGMAKTGIRTASSVMRTLSHEAGRLLDE